MKVLNFKIRKSISNFKTLFSYIFKMNDMIKILKSNIVSHKTLCIYAINKACSLLSIKGSFQHNEWIKFAFMDNMR